MSDASQQLGSYNGQQTYPLANAPTPPCLQSIQKLVLPLKDKYKSVEDASPWIGLDSVDNKRVRPDNTLTSPLLKKTCGDDPAYYAADERQAIFSEIVQTFDHMPDAMRQYVLFQLLQKSSKSTLQSVNAMVVPVLKRDLLATLPPRLAQHILSYLDLRSLCRAACVSRRWKNIIYSSAPTWKRLLERAGYPAEMERALSNHTVMPDKRKHGIVRLKASDPMEIDSDHFFAAKQELSQGEYYRSLYRRHYTTQHNWNQGRAKRIQIQTHQNHVITCLQFDPEKIISGADDCSINIYATATGQHIRSLEGHDGGVWALQYFGSTLVSGSTDRTVRVWDMEAGVCTHIFRGHNSTVRCLQVVTPARIRARIVPGVPLIVTGSRDATIRVWRLPDPKRDVPYNGTGPNPWFVCTLAGHTQSVRALAAYGNRLVSGSYDTTVCVWDLENRRLLHRMEGHTDRVYTVVIDPDRGQCMSGGMDGTVRIWDMESGKCLRLLEGHTTLVGLLALSPNYLVSAAADGYLRVWSPDTGDCKRVLRGHMGAITCFQHDEHKVISGYEGGLKMWDIETGDQICDLITDVSGVWRIAFDDRRCVAAVRRDSMTVFEVLDFGYYGLEDEVT